MYSLRITFLALAVILVSDARSMAQDKTASPPNAFRVAYKDLQLKVVGAGVLAVKDDHLVECKVKSSSRGAPKIKWVVDNGSQVKKGDLILEIDDSVLQEQAQARKIDCDKDEADKTAAETALPLKKDGIRLARLQATRDTKNAESALEAAKLELKKFDEGDKEVYRKDMKGRLADAEADVELWRERVVLAEKQLKDGKTTEALVKAKRKKLEACGLILERVKAESDVLEKFTLPRYRKQLEDAVESCQLLLDQYRKVESAAGKHAEIDLKTAEADVASKRAVWEQRQELYKDIQEQIRNCKLYAPSSGQIVYHLPAQGGSRGADQPIIAQGEPVQYGQKLMSIPDPSVLVVNLRVNEALIGYLRKGQSAHVEILGQKALRAHVLDVAKVADRGGEKLEGEGKSYTVRLQLDDAVEDGKLQRGASARCTIFTDLRTDHVLAIPVSAVVTPPEKGKKSRCRVITPRGIEEREIELGLSDGQMVEIKSGLKEGETVVDER